MRALLAGLIDDAGVFPPASLDMPGAVAAHRRSRTGRNRVLLGRFVCPAPRLEELWNEWTGAPDDGMGPLRVSVLLKPAEPWPDGLEPGVAAAAAFAAAGGGRAKIETAETRLPTGTHPAETDLSAAVSLVSAVAERVYFEVPLVPGWEVSIEAIHRLRGGIGAKVRCGGQTPGAVPTPRRLAEFVHECHRAGVPFKATAGLHHPFRHRDPQTGFVQHGFVNLAIAVVAANRDADVATLERILMDDSPAAFALEDDSLRWRELWATPFDLAHARELFRSFGSCSVDEPAEDLAGLGWLPAPAEGA